MNIKRGLSLREVVTAALLALPIVQVNFFSNVYAQTNVETLGGEVVGVPLDVDLRELPVMQWQPGDPIREVPRGDGGPADPVYAPANRDPLLDRQLEFSSRGPTPPAVTEMLNFEGNFSGANPNDPSGEIGQNFYIEGINGPGGSSITVYSKIDGSLQAGPFPMDTLGATGECLNGAGDPIIIYDHLANRWLLTEFTPIGNNDLCVYTSRTDDPISGGWCFYEFNDTSFPDYPKYGVWPDLYVAASQQGNTPPAYAFDRLNMLSQDGTTCPTARAPQKITGAPGLPGLGFEILTPVDLDGNTLPPADAPAIYIRHRDEEFHGDASPSPTEDRLELFELDVDFDNGANTTLTQLPDVIVSDFDTSLCPPVNIFSCVPQPNGAPPLDPLLEVVMNTVTYRNFETHETILGSLQTDVGDFEDHAGVRWFELRRSGGGDWELFQEGTWSPDAEGRFMSMVEMDQDGNILLGYNVSSTSVFPSIRYTGRAASDPPGVMSLGEVEFATGNATNNAARYGDYNHMSLDPVDECTFWFLGMYNPNTVGNSKGVRIGSLRFDDCDNTFLVEEFYIDGFEDLPPPP